MRQLLHVLHRSRTRVGYPGASLSPMRSRDASALVGAGASEIVLTGINIGRYRDPETGCDLADLISAVAAHRASRRLRLSSIEPPDLTDRLISTLARTPAVCEHLHVPLQSGSDTVLSAMGRKYTAEQYARADRRRAPRHPGAGRDHRRHRRIPR